jgi:hypothetical protein
MFFHGQAIPAQTGGAERSVREHTEKGDQSSDER